MVNTQMETMETWDKGHGQKRRRNTANSLQVIITTIIQLMTSSTCLACAVSVQTWLGDKEIERGRTVQDQDCVLIASSFCATPLPWTGLLSRNLKSQGSNLRVFSDSPQIVLS